LFTRSGRSLTLLNLIVLPIKFFIGIYTSSMSVCMLLTDSQTKTVCQKNFHQ